MKKLLLLGLISSYMFGNVYEFECKKLQKYNLFPFNKNGKTIEEKYMSVTDLIDMKKTFIITNESVIIYQKYADGDSFVNDLTIKKINRIINAKEDYLIVDAEEKYTKNEMSYKVDIKDKTITVFHHTFTAFNRFIECNTKVNE